MLSFPEAASVLGVPLLFPQSPAVIRGASIDTRTLQPGDLFVALKGENQDGHQFLDAAFKKGALGALIDRKFPAHPKYRNLLAVENPQAAL